MKNDHWMMIHVFYDHLMKAREEKISKKKEIIEIITKSCSRRSKPVESVICSLSFVFIVISEF